MTATVQRTPRVTTTLVVTFVSVTLGTEKKAHDASVSRWLLFTLYCCLISLL